MSTPFSITGDIMQVREQYHNLLQLQKEIDNKLYDTSFEQIIELQKHLAKSDKYKKLKSKDNRLSMLDNFCKIWIDEKKNMLDVETENDIFWNIYSLIDIENKYQDIKFFILRVENEVPEAYVKEGLDRIEKWDVSGIAIAYIILGESKKREENINCIYQLLLERSHVIKAIELLQYAQRKMPYNKEYYLAEANCWILVKQWKQALRCLLKIEDSDVEILDLIEDIKQVLKNEKD